MIVCIWGERMIWKTLRVLGGTLFDSPSAGKDGVKLNANTLKTWEIWERIIKDYSQDDRFDVWYHYQYFFSESSPGKLLKRPLQIDDDLIRLDQSVVSEYCLETGRVQIYIQVSAAQYMNPTPVYIFLEENNIPRFPRNPFQTDPFFECLTQYGGTVADRLKSVESKLASLQKPTPENIKAWQKENS